MTCDEVTRVFRVQHPSDGRGPFRPGFSNAWTDDDGELLRSTKPTWMDEFGWEATNVAGRPGEYFGTAVVRLEMLAGWFSSGECSRLAALGYVVACIPDARVLRSSENQVLFCRTQPLNIGVQIRRWP
jgi:hypothetical protein